MEFDKIIEVLAKKENVSTQEIQNEMMLAAQATGLGCSAQELVEFILQELIKRLYIVK